MASVEEIPAGYSPLEWETPLFRTALAQFEQVLPYAKIGDAAAERGIPILPDILANAGGVAVSYFEWVQDIGRLFWDREEIRSRLADKLSDAFDRVWELSRELGVLRQAALVTGIREAAAALEARGIYP